MQESLTFPTLTLVSPLKWSFPDSIHGDPESCCSDLSSTTSTPFFSAPSSPSTVKAFYFSAPASPTWPRLAPFWPQHQANVRDGDDDGDDADPDLSPSGSSLYASAVPFSWEERPGTLKAVSVAADDDGASASVSESSEFEFGARFADFQEPSMSPAPISASSERVDCRRSLCNSTFPADEVAMPADNRQHEEASHKQVWRLPPPPCLENPGLRKRQPMRNDISGHKHRHRSQSSLSASQSPRSPRKFEIRRVLCSVSRENDVAFDPFLAALQKSMEKNSRDDFCRAMGKTAGKETFMEIPHHRRTVSSTPSRKFHWDDEFSSANGCSSMEDTKSKHPIQREIDARYKAARDNVRREKYSRRWSFRGFVHRNITAKEESARHSNTSLSLQSLGQESNLSSTSTQDSCSSSATSEMPADMVVFREDMYDIKARDSSSPVALISSKQQGRGPSTPLSTLSPSASNNSSKGKDNACHKSAPEGPYAVHCDFQQAHTELLKQTARPFRWGFLGCLGFSSRGYRAIATAARRMQSVT